MMKEIQYETITFKDPDFKMNIYPDADVFLTSTAQYSQRIYHEEVEIKYFYEGDTTLIVGSETIVAHPGDIVIVDPYEFHTTVSMGKKRGKNHLFMVGLDFFKDRSIHGLDLRSLLIGRRLSFYSLIRRNTELSNVLCQVAQEYKNKKEHYLTAIESLMTQVFITLLREAVRDGESDPPRSENMRYYADIDPALRIIHTQYMRKITVDELADACNVSKCYFCRIFRYATGRTAIQYITEYRLRFADAMLSNTKKNISQIAEECGFSDESYFSRCYKKIYGVSPKQQKAK